MGIAIKTNYIETQKFVYSILFGLTINNFMTSVFRFWNSIKGPSGVNWSPILLIFLGIQIYFFLNCFRYLFGLLNFTEMIGNDFAPKEEEWANKYYLRSLFKKLIMNIGIIQLIIFSVLSFLISTLGENSISKNYYNTNFIDDGIKTSYLQFFALDLLLLVTDAIAVRGFRYFEKQNTTAENRVTKNWNYSTNIEMLCNLFAIFLAMNYSDFKTGKNLVGFKLFLLSFELIGGYFAFNRFWSWVKQTFS